VIFVENNYRQVGVGMRISSQLQDATHLTKQHDHQPNTLMKKPKQKRFIVELLDDYSGEWKTLTKVITHNQAISFAISLHLLDYIATGKAKITELREQEVLA